MTEYSIFKILFLIIGSKHIFILYTKSTCNKYICFELHTYQHMTKTNFILKNIMESWKMKEIWNEDTEYGIFRWHIVIITFWQNFLSSHLLLYFRPKSSNSSNSSNRHNTVMFPRLFRWNIVLIIFWLDFLSFYFSCLCAPNSSNRHNIPNFYKISYINNY